MPIKQSLNLIELVMAHQIISICEYLIYLRSGITKST